MRLDLVLHVLAPFPILWLGTVETAAAAEFLSGGSSIGATIALL